ncbi:MAG: uracil-DNA glycosylase family protein [Puniceicoccaceae bacterium]
MRELNEVLTGLAEDLRDSLERLDWSIFPGFVYHPLQYAWQGHAGYLKLVGAGGRRPRVVFLGMNPGPWGMMQTGVPFGEVDLVRHWMGIEAPLERPEREHPKRPIRGWECTRSEVSGRRLWGYFKDRFGTAEACLEEIVVLNYCPLAFLAESGANLTPDKFSAAVVKDLFELCDTHLRAAVLAIDPEWVLGVGKFALGRIETALEGVGARLRMGTILHPSPASPAANRGWAEAAERQLASLGVWG